MFGTLHYDANNNFVEFSNRTYGFVQHNGAKPSSPHSACDLCRAKKLRCTGQKTGCDRCKASSNKCTYSTDDEDGPRRRQRSSAIDRRKAQRTDKSPTGTAPNDNNRENADGESFAKASIKTAQQNGTSTRSSSIDWQPKPVEHDITKDLQDENTDMQDADLMLYSVGDEFDIVNPSSNMLPMSFNLQTPPSRLSESPDVLNPKADDDFSINVPAKPPSRRANPSPTVRTPLYDMSDATSDDLDFFARPPLPLDNGSSINQLVNNTSRSRQDCQCFSTLVSLLEQLPASPTELPLDMYLTTLKTCMAKTYTVVTCQTCMSKADPVVLLVLVLEKMVALCEDMVKTCLNAQINSQWDSPDTADILDREPNCSGSLGRYQINSTKELKFLQKAATLYQVKELGRQFLMVRVPASHLLRGAQITRILNCKFKLSEMVKSLQIV